MIGTLRLNSIVQKNCEHGHVISKFMLSWYLILLIPELCLPTYFYNKVRYNGTALYYIPITDTTLELSVFWPSERNPDQRTEVF